MTRKSAAAAMLAAAGFAAYAPQAMAQGTLSSVTEPTFFDYGGGQEFRNNAGDAVGVLYDASRQPTGSAQTIGTDVEGRSDVGVTYTHEFSRAGNIGTYDLTAELGADSVGVTAVRDDLQAIVSVDGTVAGESFALSTYKPLSQLP